MKITPVDKPAAVLFSGGMDSTVCLYWTLKAYSRAEALAFDYGQRHSVELGQARLIAEMTGVPLTVINLRGIFGGDLVGENQITDPVIPCRNAVFLSVAAAWGFARGINAFVAGFNATDATDFPDCRHGFVRAMEIALKEGLQTNVDLICPLMGKTKAHVWKMAKDLGCLGTVVEHTHSDYYGNRDERHAWGYGRLDNEASRRRAAGYEEAVTCGWV